VLYVVVSNIIKDLLQKPIDIKVFLFQSNAITGISEQYGSMIYTYTVSRKKPSATVLMLHIATLQNFGRFQIYEIS